MSFKVKIDKNKCSICEMCAVKCPAKAITIRRNGKIEELVFDYKLCNMCNGNPYCELNCPEKAIKIIPKKTSLKRPLVLVSAALINCVDCGLLFVPERKIKIIRKKRGIKRKKIQEYCPDCRRKNLLIDISSN